MLLLGTLDLVARASSGGFDEAWLQKIIHANPACLPINEIESGLSLFQSVCREMPTPHGPMDNLLMTPQGNIAIVETKLFRNPEARRKVVAQALDYAISLFTMDYAAFEKAVLGGQFDGPPPKSLYEALGEGEKLREDAFHDAVATNLRKGRARWYWSWATASRPMPSAWSRTCRALDGSTLPWP